MIRTVIRRVTVSLLCLCLLTGQGCKQIPTSVLLRVEAGPGLGDLDELRLTVFSDQGREVKDERLPPCKGGECAAPSLPDDVALFPEQSSGTLRLLARGLAKSVVAGEGAGQVALESGEQVSVMVVVQAGTLPDQDGDGVPDSIDNCQDRPNPEQGPCAGPDGGVDLQLEAGLDTSADGPTDGPGLDLQDGLPPCTCPLGCKPGTVDCRALVPSGGFALSTYSSIPPIASDVTVDTTTCKVTVGAMTVTGSIQTGSAGGKACVIGLSALTITSGVTLSAAGDHPLALLVLKDTKIFGVLDAGGKGGTPGPGGGKGGLAVAGGPGAAGSGPGGGKVCQCSTTTGDDCGGGGGGFGMTGANGGTESTPCEPSTGGSTYGDVGLMPLAGGSGGASGGQATAGILAGSGGGGGGAIQISCQGTIIVDGGITVGGGGGLAGPLTAGGAGGGAGGSGGAILLEATSLSGKGLLAVNGGGGAAGTRNTCGQGGGGEDGSAKLAPAKGGAALGATCGDGGDGGWAAAPAKVGESFSVEAAAGGGGGGVGRIRLNWYNHGVTAPVLVSGVVGLGEAAVQ